MPIQIYYLDDETDLLEVFSDTFGSDTVTITTFTDPETFIAECFRNPPDLVLVDHRLPGMTGDIVSQRLDPSVPKFLVTGDLQVATEYQFKAIIHKPFDIDKIKAAIEEHSFKRKSF